MGCYQPIHSWPLNIQMFTCIIFHTSVQCHKNCYEVLVEYCCLNTCQERLSPEGKLASVPQGIVRRPL